MHEDEDSLRWIRVPKPLDRRPNQASLATLTNDELKTSEIEGEQLNAALCKAGQCPGLYKLMGHSHMSEIYSINSADKTVGNLMKQLVDRVR